MRCPETGAVYTDSYVQGVISENNDLYAEINKLNKDIKTIKERLVKYQAKSKKYDKLMESSKNLVDALRSEGVI